jgi:peptidyl-prolyl cis-trans isomerase SurA
MLASIMEGDVRNKVTVIPAEVDRYFQKLNKDSLSMIPDQYVYGQIILYPPSLEEAKLRAREQLLALRQRISNGERFGVLAQMYSRDDASAVRAGESDWTTSEMLVRPFAEALERLRPGMISPVVETEFGFHIAEVLERKGNQFRYRHILIRPEYTSTEMSETAQRLDSIAGLIRTGELTFQEAALKYSQDEYSKYNGGEVTNREIIELQGGGANSTSNRFTLELLGQIGSDHLYLRTMKPGEISNSYLTYDLRGNQQVKIVRLKEIIPAHRADLKEDYTLVEGAALREKQQRVYDEWLQKTIAAMYIRINPKYLNCDFQIKGWVK